jgi:hypothetical protein
MITLYLDMDGVLCNFDKAYRSLRTHATDGKRFRAAVLEFHIFENLKFMPDTKELLNYVSNLNVNIEILTSVGTFDVEQGNAARLQKQKWLDTWNIPYNANFVRSKEEKSQYAHDRAILVDDSIGCITPFNDKGGHGILHTTSSDSIKQINAIINGISGLYALRKEYA